MPGAMFTISENPTDVGWKLNTFIDKYTRAEDEEWIFFYGRRNPKEGDIQLWLNSDS